MPERWDGGQTPPNLPTCLAAEPSLMCYRRCGFVLGWPTGGDLLWRSLIWSVTGHSNSTDKCILLCFYPRLSFEHSCVLWGSVRCVVTNPRVGSRALIWSCRFPWLPFHLLSHLLWCIKPSLVVCVLFNPFNCFDCWMLKDKGNK